MASPEVQVPDHPARYSGDILQQLQRMVRDERKRLGRPITVLDPFAGVGGIHRLARLDGVTTVGVEIQHGWATAHPDTVWANSLEWMPASGKRFDIVATSPTYGNRFADHHDAQDGSRRVSYAHNLRAAGEELEAGSSAGMPWGPDYWRFHADAYRAVADVLEPGGLFILNVSDLWRQQVLVQAHLFHRGAAMGAGLLVGGRDVKVTTPRLRGVGSDRTAKRAPHEVIMRFRKPEGG